jgi:hypothetical protein
MQYVMTGSPKQVQGGCLVSAGDSDCCDSVGAQDGFNEGVNQRENECSVMHHDRKSTHLVMMYHFAFIIHIDW